jgi:uncharacterized protein YqgV (UPF0045/DUF77 family)
MIAIQVSLYPIEQKDINKGLEIFWRTLKENSINYRITPLSTITWDEDEDRLYNAIFKAYREARKQGPAVMVTTLTTGKAQRIEKLLEFNKNS